MQEYGPPTQQEYFALALTIVMSTDFTDDGLNGNVWLPLPFLFSANVVVCTVPLVKYTEAFAAEPADLGAMSR